MQAGTAISNARAATHTRTNVNSIARSPLRSQSKYRNRVANVLTAGAGDLERLNGALNQLCAYAAQIVLQEIRMVESIFARVSRLLSAAVEDSVDRMEQAGGDAVMREAIREADRAIDQVKAELESTMARRLQAARHQRMLIERAEELTTKARFALGREREDLAEAALSRQVDFEAQAKGLDVIQKSATVAARLAALKAQQAA